MSIVYYSALVFKRSTRFLFLFLFLLLTMVSTSLSAQLQELELTPVENTNGTIPVFRDYPDDAALIISSSLTDLKFDSNVGIVADLSSPNDGEYRLIIPPFRQSITVTMNGYRQLRFTVPVSEPRQVLFYEINPMVTEEELIPIVLSLSPLDASVFIDEQGIDPNQVIRLSPGSHQIRIEKEGYKTITEEMMVSESSFRFDYRLSPLQPVRVTVTTTPSDARLEINNVDRGTTDWQNFIFPGQYFLRLSKNGYKTIQETITVVENPSNDPALNNFDYTLDSFEGELILTLNPPNARVFLNRQPYNANQTINVPPGQYLLQVESDGYIPFSETIVVTEDALLNRSITLQQIVGTLQMTIQPISANVTLRNSSGVVINRWQGANLLNNVPIGTYTLSASAENFQDYSETVSIRENQTTVSNIAMTSISVIEQQERERQRQLEIDQQNIQEARERKAREVAAKEKRRGFFKHRSMGGLYLHYNTFTADAAGFSTNVDEQYGYGIGFFRYSNYKTLSMDFVYNSYTLINSSNLPEEIISYNFSASFIPTLPIGPFMVGFGGGIDYSQYEDPDELSYFYTVDPFYSLQFAFKPKSWNIGFLMDTRTSIEAGLTDYYYPWSQVKFSFIWAYN